MLQCGALNNRPPRYLPCLLYTSEFADYISLHQYYGGQERGTDEFLSQSVEMEEYIQTVIGICDTVRSKKRSDKKIDICFDEWGVWEIPGGEVADSVAARDWEVAPAFSEQIYTMEDALLFASCLLYTSRCVEETGKEM